MPILSAARPSNDAGPSNDARLSQMSSLVATLTGDPSDPDDIVTAIRLRVTAPDDDFDDALESLKLETGSSETTALAAMLRAMAFFNAAAAELRVTGQEPPDSVTSVLGQLAARLAVTQPICTPWGDDVVVTLDDPTYTDIRRILGLLSH
jgi:hypothetical protein